MPKIKSSIQDVKATLVRTSRNSMAKSLLRTSIRRFEKALGEANTDRAQDALSRAVKIIDKSVTRGILHRNAAARRKSRMTKKFNALTKAAVTA